MLCRDVKRVVYFFLDGTLGEKKRAEFDQHLHLCPDCERRTRVHTRLRDLIRNRVTKLSTGAPDRLKRRLTRSIRAFRAEWSR